MRKKFLPTIMSVVVLLSLTSGFLFVPPFVWGKPALSIEKRCDMEGCSNALPECPLCLSAGLFIFCAHQAADFHNIDPSSHFVLVTPDRLVNQEFIKPIFRPPKPVL